VIPTQPESVPAAVAGARLQQALRAALQARDTVAVSALRSAQAALGNAESVVHPPAAPGHGHQHIAGSIEGVGAAEAPRRALSDAEVGAIIAAEISERREAAELYQRVGHADRAARLRREADALAALFAETSAAPPTEA
jgi:uncharacterized protein